ncbi:MAG: alanine/ornithine racemase family PLP-dependent enzyme [Clostridia bacterium]|nr:alanine/ornithine racemase family PLP-dependent enzyme [Clostridia bacterium]
MYPKIQIKLSGIIENVKRTKELCKQNGISLAVVTKLLADNREIVQAIVESGVDYICDSRIQNLISYKDINTEKWLIRSPSNDEIPDVIRYADASLNSEIETIKKLNAEAKKQGKTHKVILMYELGDLREGCLKPELEEIAGEALHLSNIELYGVGVNLSCYGEIVPSEKNMKELEEVVLELERKYNIKFKMVSGGNSSSFNMMKNGRLPNSINNLRMGEAIYLGNIPCFEEKIDEFNQDNFIVKAEIIELKEKPSVPWGECGLSNSFGEHSTFTDRGTRKRAIIGLGKQDVKLEGITPLDEGIIILGGSSDHIILDVSDSEKQYKVGDIIEFMPNYAGVLSCMTSKYVQKEIVR